MQSYPPAWQRNKIKKKKKLSILGDKIIFKDSMMISILYTKQIVLKVYELLQVVYFEPWASQGALKNKCKYPTQLLLLTYYLAWFDTIIQGAKLQ